MAGLETGAPRATLLRVDSSDGDFGNCTQWYIFGLARCAVIEFDEAVFELFLTDCDSKRKSHKICIVELHSSSLVTIVDDYFDSGLR